MNSFLTEDTEHMKLKPDLNGLNLNFTQAS